MKRYLFAFGPNEEVIFKNYNNQIHRIGQPAIIYKNKRFVDWVFNGKHHKINGISAGRFGYYLYDEYTNLNISRLVI